MDEPKLLRTGSCLQKSNPCRAFYTFAQCQCHRALCEYPTPIVGIACVCENRSVDDAAIAASSTDHNSRGVAGPPPRADALGVAPVGPDTFPIGREKPPARRGAHVSLMQARSTRRAEVRTA